MKTLFIIGIGGFTGSICRFLLSQFIQSKSLSSFPFGTLGVNIVGCFIIGFVIGMSERSTMSSDWRFFLATGICGGFTTFSAFSSETFGLLRDGQFFYAGIYIIASLALGIFATFSAYSIIKFT